MVMACLTMSWALILLNKYKVVIHATSRVEFTPLFSAEGRKENVVTSDSTDCVLRFISCCFIIVGEGVRLQTCIPARDSSYLRMCSTRLSTSWTQAFLAGLYDASSSDLRS